MRMPLAMAVPPAAIAANRAQLSSLLARKDLGQNAPAIAVVEADYAEMWAKDATAMYSYAGASAAASRLAPFAAPPFTSACGLASQATGGVDVAGADARTTLLQLTSALPEALETLASPASSASGSSRPLIGNGARAISSFAPVSAPSCPSTSPDTDASVGRGVSLGALSVPQTWVSAARAVTAAAPALPGNDIRVSRALPAGRLAIA
jgi:PPE-repeat protein